MPLVCVLVLVIFAPIPLLKNLCLSGVTLFLMREQQLAMLIIFGSNVTSLKWSGI